MKPTRSYTTSSLRGSRLESANQGDTAMHAKNMNISFSEAICAVFGVAIFLAVVAVAGPSDTVEAAAAAGEGRFPDMGGAVAWLNSPPLSGHSLRGKVVLVNFWTYSCINTLRELPYMKAWAAKYKDAGLVVIGVHTPEFGFEKERANVQQALHDLKITYPVAIDSNYGIWRAFRNNYWPANYLSMDEDEFAITISGRANMLLRNA